MNAKIYVFGKEECVQGTHQGFLARSIPARRRHSLRSRLRTSKKKDTQMRVFLFVFSEHYGSMSVSAQQANSFCLLYTCHDKMQLGFLLFLFQLQNPMILRQHAHLLNCDCVELCQSFWLRQTIVDEHRIQILQIGKAHKL